MHGVDPSTEWARLGNLVDMLPYISNIDRFQLVIATKSHASRLTTMGKLEVSIAIPGCLKQICTGSCKYKGNSDK